MAELRPLEAAVASTRELPLRRIGRPIGRDDLLRSLLKRLAEKQALVLHGAPGIGKTTIAATIANVYTQQPDQTVLWLPVADPPLVELLVRIGRAYGALDVCNAANPLRERAAVADLLQRHQPLVVLDGSIDETVLNRFYEDCAGDSALLVTSEQVLAGGALRNQAIGNLREDAALQLFKQKAGMQADEADDTVAAIVAQLNHEAFPVVLAARSMIISRQSPDAFHEALAKLLDEHAGQAATAALSASYAALNPRMQGLLKHLGATPSGQASISFLRLLSDMPVSAIDQAMEILSRLFLVERFQRLEETCYRLHPLVQALVIARTDAEEGLRERVNAALSAFLVAHSDGPDALIRLLTELDNLAATLSWAMQAGDQELADNIVEALSSASGLADEAGYAYELAMLQARRDGAELEFDLDLHDEDAPSAGQDSAVDLAIELDDVSAVEDGDETVDLADNDGAEKVKSVESVDEATQPARTAFADDSTFISIDDDELRSVNIDQLRTALHVARQNDETDRQLQILKAIAKIQINQERQSDAAATFAEVLSLYEAKADAAGALETLDALAGLLLSGDDVALILDQLKLRPALKLASRHQDSARVLQILDAIGKAQIEEQRESEAMSTFNEVLAIQEAKGDKAGTLEALDMLAGLLVRRNAAVTAQNHIRRGLRLADELGDRETEMYLLATLGDAHRALGEAAIASENYGKALAIARDRDDQQNEAYIMFQLGMGQLDAGDTRQAIEMLEGANELFKQQSNREMEAMVLRGLGEINVKLQRWSEAVNYNTSALYIAREIQDIEQEAQQLRMLGAVLIQAQRLPEALTRYRQALHLAYESENAATIVGVLGELVNLMMRNPFYASICELLVNDGLSYDPEDRELLRLQPEVATAKERVAARGDALAVVAGTAREYAEIAYKNA